MENIENRLIRVEEKVESIDKKVDSMDSKLDVISEVIIENKTNMRWAKRLIIIIITACIGTGSVFGVKNLLMAADKVPANVEAPINP